MVSKLIVHDISADQGYYCPKSGDRANQPLRSADLAGQSPKSIDLANQFLRSSDRHQSDLIISLSC